MENIVCFFFYNLLYVGRLGSGRIQIVQPHLGVPAISGSLEWSGIWGHHGALETNVLTVPTP